MSTTDDITAVEEIRQQVKQLTRVDAVELDSLEKKVREICRRPRFESLSDIIAEGATGIKVLLHDTLLDIQAARNRFFN